MDDLHAAVYDLVQRFVERQRLPYEVIKKYRPHWLDRTQPRPGKEYASITQWGYWGDDKEWKYFLHGVGCLLTQVITQEVIDWDCPNLYCFDQYSFARWLHWFLSQNPSDQSVFTLLPKMDEQGDDFRNRIIEILAKLHQLGKLRDYPGHAKRYELLIEENRSEAVGYEAK
jgi:hypothetical protein